MQFHNNKIAKVYAKKFSIEIKDIDLALINALRRIILSEIPVVGFRGEDEPSLEVISKIMNILSKILK